MFTLLDDCGKAYRLADGFERRCFNQALFEKIRTYDDKGVEADFAEPFASLLDSSIFMLKNEYARIQDGQPNEVAHLAFATLMKKSKIKTSTFFTGTGLSKSTYLPEAGLEPARVETHGILSPGRLPIPPLGPAFYRQRLLVYSIN